MAEKTGRPLRRLEREEKTIAAMIALYCRGHHTDAAGVDDGLCDECATLLHYARLRLAKCRYGADKPTCANCATHCYKPEMRARVRAVMRYSGPRMLRRHPWLTAAHLTDRRRTPDRD